MLVKALGGGVAFPDVKRYVIAADALRVAFDILVQSSADVLSAGVFVNAEIVYVQRLYVGEYVVIGELLYHAERVAEKFAVLKCRKYRLAVVACHLCEFLVCVLLHTAFEQIGSAFVMYFKHLAQQTVQTVNISRFRSSYLHFLLPFRVITCTDKTIILPGFSVVKPSAGFIRFDKFILLYYNTV